MPQSIFRLAATGLLTALALGSVGCGVGGPVVHVEGRRVSLTLDEYRILPRMLSVPAGRVLIVVRNRGVLTHDVALEREGIDANGKPTILGITPVLLPGAEGSILTSPLAPGRYVLTSTIGNQAVLGMSGFLIVRTDPSRSSAQLSATG
jgi:hypothetical protein